MTIVAVSSVKNEGDFIEPFVRHTCGLVDRLLVLDDGSRDDTVAILRKLQAEGLPLEVIEHRSLRKDQKQRMTWLVHEAGHRLQADWVFLLDADELLCVAPGQPLIPADARSDVCLRICWRGYVALPAQDANEVNPAIRLQHRRAMEPHPTWKVIIPGPLARASGGRVEQGNHCFWIDDQPVESQPCDTVWIAHYPLRSPAQFLARVVGTTLSYLAMPDRHPDWGWSCRESLERIKRNPESLESEFFQASLQYGIPHAHEQGLRPEVVTDPAAYLGGPLRYTAPTPGIAQAVATLARIGEDYARHVAVLSAPLNEQETVHVEHQASMVGTLQQTLAQRDQERSQLIARVEELRASQTGLIRDLETQRRESTERLLASELQLQEQRQAHALQLQEQQTSSADELGELQSASTRELQEQQSMHDRERQEQQSMRVQELRELLQSHALELQDLRQSFESSLTWRSGRLVLAPFRALRRSSR